jgi:hypothetical protein
MEGMVNLFIPSCTASGNPRQPRGADEKLWERTQRFVANKWLTRNVPSKRTGYFAQNELSGGANQKGDAALARGERVARDGAFSSRRGSGEGSRRFPTAPHNKQK